MRLARLYPGVLWIACWMGSVVNSKHLGHTELIAYGREEICVFADVAGMGWEVNKGQLTRVERDQ